MPYSIAQARDQLSRVVREAERGEPVELTRRGRPVAVVVAIDRYRRLRGERRDFWDAYQGWLERTGWRDPEREDGIPEDFFAAVRDRTTGREFQW